MKVVADPADCSVQLKLTGSETFSSACDIATSALVSKSVTFDVEKAAAGTPAEIRVGDTTIPVKSTAGLAAADAKAQNDALAKSVAEAISKHGYPASADPAAINRPMTILLLFILVLYVTLVYAPIAAWPGLAVGGRDRGQLSGAIFPRPEKSAKLPST